MFKLFFLRVVKEQRITPTLTKEAFKSSFNQAKTHSVVCFAVSNNIFSTIKTNQLMDKFCFEISREVVGGGMLNLNQRQAHDFCFYRVYVQLQFGLSALTPEHQIEK